MIRFANVSLPCPGKRLWQPTRLGETIHHPRDIVVLVVKSCAGFIPTWLTSVGNMWQLWLRTNHVFVERERVKWIVESIWFNNGPGRTWTQNGHDLPATYSACWSTGDCLKSAHAPVERIGRWHVGPVKSVIRSVMGQDQTSPQALPGA